eukprot:g1150.t1
MSLENKYRKWERYDVDEAIEKVDVSYRKNERKEERNMVEQEASRMRKIEAEILTAKERVRDLIAETGFRLRDRRRNKIPSISETSPKLLEIKKSDAIIARQRSGYLERAISERDRARSFLKKNDSSKALTSFISALKAADSGGAIRRDIGHRHVPIDWDIDSLSRSSTWDDENRRNCCDDPSHDHYRKSRRHESKVDSLSSKDQIAVNNLAVDAMIGSARCCLHLEQYLRTIEYLTPVLEQDKNNITALLWRGEAFLKLGAPIIARHHLNRCETLEESRDWKDEISTLRNMIESSEQRHTIEDDADVDDMKEDENDNSGNVLCDVVMKRCENDLLSAGIMLDAEARVFEREAFYKSALNRYCASLRIFQKLSNPHNIHALRHRIAAHLSVARCTHLCHAQCTFSATARNVALSHCEAAQVLIKFFESLRPEKKKEYEDDSSCSCTYHGNQVRDLDLYETATLLRSQLLAEGSNFADAIAVLTSISSLKTNDTVRKKIDRVKYQADKHGRSEGTKLKDDDDEDDDDNGGGDSFVAV